ncbi:FecR family protein [Dyadobacter pollutisoli]|uniref:FecR family protein n=1 Tax=Dyadobacter pollutisoli TaxID=2910158 RepID=A0A9E8SRC7_9BACT|nr:FecR family protein [Dyadobacter pollutisoli]WAC14027.1 FecR family protein [Dyadobacter pollutisoli]
MKNYESYQLEDFLADQGFIDWVRGRGSQGVFWAAFTEKYPDKTELFQEAERLTRAANVKPEGISEKEIRAEVALFIERASAPETPEIVPLQEEKVVVSSFSRIRWVVAAAAVVLIAIGINWYLAPGNVTKPNIASTDVSPPNLVTTSNDTEKPLKILLVDGSEVILSPKSCLSYPSQFDDSSRIVYLTGEAMFSVKHQGQTFMVYTGDVVTKVLGTRFVVSAFDKDKKITVQVQTGKVSVYVEKPELSQRKKEVNGLIITANQAAIFEKSIHQLSKTLVENPEKLTKEAVESISKYEEVPLPVLFQDIEKAYGIPVQFDAENFRTCKITATLSNENMYEKLDILCKTVSASYEIVDGQIIISGKGCK